METSTPILDLVVPLPTRNVGDLKWWQALLVLAGLFLGVPGLAFALSRFPWLVDILERAGRSLREVTLGFSTYGPIVVPLLSLVAGAAILVVHELGHVVAGLACGFRLNAMFIGPVSVAAQGGRLKLGFHLRTPALGLTLMRTDKAVRLRRRLAIFVAGGPIADLTCALFAETLIVGGVPIPWLWFARLFLWLSLVALLFDVIPYRLRGFATDGARLLTLAVSPAQTKRWLSLAALERQMEREPQARHWNRHWLKVAASVEDQAREAQRANWLAYAHADAVDDVAAAAKYLERCLALAGAGDPGFRRLVILEAAVFTAWSRRDAAKAGAWFAKVPQPRRLTPLLRLRGEVARQWVQGNSEAAMLSWSKALDLIRNLPDTPQRVALESSWQEWKQQLTERNPKSH